MPVRRIASITAAVFVLLPALLQARIGESFDECTKRYGRHVRLSDDGKVHVFESGRFRIFIEFNGDSAEEVIYRKIPPGRDYVGKPVQLATSEIHSLLKSNFGEGEWDVAHPDLYTIAYSDPQGGWNASYSTLTGNLILLTRAAAERLAAAKQEADDNMDAAGLEGL